ncbi:MAG: hypothetical protein ACM3SV_04410 [Betaproteobacteria bacterium]
MKTLLALTFVLAALIATPAQAQRTPEAVVNYENVYLQTSSGKKLSDAEFKDAVIRAGKSHNWQFTEAASGRLVGSLTVNEKHMISVNVDRTPENFSVTYRDSANMNYGSIPKSVENPWLESAKANIRKTSDPNAKLIHPAYNQWVRTLVNAIKQEIFRL